MISVNEHAARAWRIPPASSVTLSRLPSGLFRVVVYSSACIAGDSISIDLRHAQVVGLVIEDQSPVGIPIDELAPFRFIAPIEMAPC